MQRSSMPLPSLVAEHRRSSYQLPAVDTLAADPRQLRFVPIVYVDEDGTPTCYEVVQPVSSPSLFARSTSPPAGLSTTFTVCLSVTCGQYDGRVNSSAYTHTRPFNGPFSGTTQVSRYQKGKTNLDFTEARDSEWQWHQLGYMQVCT